MLAQIDCWGHSCTRISGGGGRARGGEGAGATTGDCVLAIAIESDDHLNNDADS